MIFQALQHPHDFRSVSRRATTHWELASEIAGRFPRVQFDPDVLYVEDGRVLTSAGTAASIDTCLHVLRQRVGATVANRVARRLVVAPHRKGGQGCWNRPTFASTSLHRRPGSALSPH